MKGVFYMVYQSAPWQARQSLLIGEEGCGRLAGASIAVIGLGGVGGAAVEALARAGVGRLILMDHDQISLTNINRQLLATRETVGMQKTEAAAARVKSINPGCQTELLPVFYSPETAEALFSLEFGLLIDCIDTVTAKLDLAVQCKARGIHALACLGTGNRLDPGAFRMGDISETAKAGGDGLARVMRRELRRRGIEKARVLYSTEPPRKTVIAEGGRYAPGSISVCPPAAGYLLAADAISYFLARD